MSGSKCICSASLLFDLDGLALTAAGKIEECPVKQLAQQKTDAKEETVSAWGIAAIKRVTSG